MVSIYTKETFNKVYRELLKNVESAKQFIQLLYTFLFTFKSLIKHCQDEDGDFDTEVFDSPTLCIYR